MRWLPPRAVLHIEVLENRIQPSGTVTPGVVSGDSLLVSEDNNVVLVNALTGATISTIATGVANDGSAVAANGDIYVGDYNNNQILYYSPTGALLGKFATSATPQGLFFGPDGNLYITTTASSVLKYSPTGTGLGTFIAAGSGGLENAKALAWDTEGNVYVSSYDNSEVLRYNANTGGFEKLFATGSGGIEQIAIGPNGNLYAASYGNSDVEVFNGSNGTLIGAIGSGITDAYGIQFDPAGNMDVSSRSGGDILVYSTAGVLLSTLVTGFTNPSFLSVSPTLATTEAGGTTSVSFELSAIPLFPVTVDLSLSDPTQGTLSTSTLTFTTTNWDVPQTVTVAGLDVHAASGSQAYQIDGTTSSSDSNYASLSLTPVPIINYDTDTATATTLHSSGNSTYGQSATFTATVTDTGSTTPTGSVVFLDGATQLATVPLSSGAATYATSALFAGTHSLTAEYQAGSGLAESSSTALVQTVSPATLTVTASSTSKTYGDPNPTYSYGISGFVNGDTSSVISGSPYLTTPATSSSAVGKYPIIAALGDLQAENYTFAFINGTLTVNPATLTVAANDLYSTYGASLPTLTDSITGFVNGDTPSVISGTAHLSTTASTGSGVGSYTISISQNNLVAANYTFTFVDGSLNITKAVLTVTAGSGSMVYGGTVPSLTDTITGYVNGDGPSVVSGSPSMSTTATSSSGVGSYPIDVTLGTLSAANYTFNFVGGAITVTPAALTVTADNKSKTYGNADPTLTWDVTGFVNGDTVSVVSGSPRLATAATSGSGVGSYTITASLGTFRAANYTFSFVNGTLAIDPATLTVTANGLTSVYGQPLPSLTDSISGFVNGDSPSVVSGTARLSTTASAGSAVGNYTISVSQNTLAAANYTFTFVDGSLDITKAVLTVTAGSSSMVYGGMVPALTDIISGYVNGDGPSVVSGEANLSSTVSSSSRVGTYPVIATLGTLSAVNYSFNFVDGAIGVTPATLTVTATDASRTYGSSNPTFSYGISGFVNGDTASVVSGSPQLTTTATIGSGVGNYVIAASQGNLTSANYNFSFVDGTLAVDPATLTVAANDLYSTYGAALPTLTDSITGFVNGDSASVVSGTADLSTTASAGSAVGSYPISVSVGTLIAANYTFTFTDGTLDITKAVLTVTAGSGSMVYGGMVPPLTDTITGYVNGDGPGIVSGSPNLSTTATSSSGVGSYPVDASLGTLSAANYSFNFVDGAINVTPATLTVTAANVTKVYGQANPAFTDNITGFVNGDTESVVSGTASLSSLANAGSSVGYYSIAASVGSLYATNYTFTFVDGILAVTPATLTVTADALSCVYGQPLPTLTDSITGFVDGDTPGVVSGTAGLSTTASAGSPVGSYPINVSLGTLTASNYTFTFVDGTLDITKAVLTVTASSGSMVYGGTVPSLTDTISGYVNGDGPGVVSGSPNSSTTATSSSGVGSYPVDASLGTLSAANYSFEFIEGAISVTPAELTVTANDAAKTYGSANPTFSYSISGFVNGDAESVVSGSAYLTTSAASGSGVGQYTITFSQGNLRAANYTFSFINGTLTVDPATLAVSADDLYSTYGAALLTLTDSINGFVNGDTSSVVLGTADLSTTASAGSGVGSYPISVSLGTLSAANYTFTFTDGMLDITKAVLTVTPGSGSMVYGSSVPALTDTITGYVNGDGPSVVSGSPSLSTAATSSSGVGSYPVSAALGTLNAVNYSFNFVDGAISVNPATLIVTANDASKTYGDANPAFSYGITGFVNGDTVSDISGSPQFITSGTVGSGVGSYPITSSVGSLEATNYKFSFVDGSLTVYPAKLTVTANSSTSVYGQPLPALTDSITGFVNGDTPSVVSGMAGLSTTASAGSPVGSYPINVSLGTLTASNYTFSFVDGALDITKAILTVTAGTDNMVYGSAVPALTDTITGYVNGDGPSVVSGSPSLNTAATSSSGVGGFPVVASLGTLDAANYSFTFVNGMIEVTQATLTVTANNATRRYGDANPTFSYSISGFVNGDTASDISGSPDLTTAATVASDTGEYITQPEPGTLEAANYSFTFTPGTLAVTPATLTVTATDAFVMVGNPLPEFGYTLAGFVNGDSATVVSGSPAFSTLATSSSAAGDYFIIPSAGTLNAKNYSFAFVDGTLTVSATPPVLTVTATDTTWVEGQPIPELTYSISGFVNDDSARMVSGAPALTATVADNSPAGTYPITVGPGTLSAPGYTVAFTNGTLTVIQPPPKTQASGTDFATTLSGVAVATGSVEQALGVVDGSSGSLSGPLPMTVAVASLNPGSASAPRGQLLPPLRTAAGTGDAAFPGATAESGIAAFSGRSGNLTSIAHIAVNVKAADAIAFYDRPTSRANSEGESVKENRSFESSLPFTFPAASSTDLAVESVFAQLDEAMEGIAASADEQSIANTLVVSSGIAVAGSFLLNTRAVYWFLSALLARPAVWRRFDPLEVIYAWERERVRETRHAVDESLESMVT